MQPFFKLLCDLENAISVNTLLATSKVLCTRVIRIISLHNKNMN